MTWVRIDDGMPRHPKFIELDDDAALALWVRGLLYASKFRTGAFVPISALPLLSGATDPEGLAEQLVAAKLWVGRGGGYGILGGGEFWSKYSDGYWCKSACPEVYRRDGSACRYCGSATNLTIDHVVPRCHGGGNTVDNLVVACWKCNHRKRGRTPEQASMALRPLPGGK